MGLLYKGFKWASEQQNVYLWLSHQAGLNQHAVDMIARAKKEGQTLEWAAEKLLEFFKACSPCTPDGIIYTKSNLLKALVGLDES